MNRELFSSIEGAGSLEKAFRYIYEKNYTLVMRISYRITGNEAASEDICQEAFIRLYERLDHFRTEDDVKFWMIRVVKNLSLNYEKKKVRENRLIERLGIEDQDKYFPSSDQEMLDNESTNQIQSSLELLPHKLRIVLILREYEGFSYKEISRTLKISESNVKIRAYRARQMLMAILGKEGFHVS